MFTILFLNQKGGVGKTTLADELAFALERRGSTVAFVSTDPQGGSVHEVCDDPDYAESCDYQIVDTATHRCPPPVCCLMVALRAISWR